MSRKERREKKATELAPALGARETLRWSWRQLTSMRTALFLLMLLAITAVPGSIVPQRGVDARRVETYLLDHPDLGPWLDRLGFFSVYTSPWFSAVYVLLMISLVGCIIPRCFVYAKALKARPPKAPRNFSRLPASATFEVDAEPEAVLEAGRKALGRSRTDVDTDLLEVRSEKGYLRELGNLIFHVSVVVVLVSVAVGALYSYRGSAVVVQGDSFANTLTQYDEFSSGALFDTDKLPYFSLDLKNMQAQFLE
ncbi:MAG: cytochrome c biogenesis protein ResB, partial [Actinomycetales bacterium]